MCKKKSIYFYNHENWEISEISSNRINYIKSIKWNTINVKTKIREEYLMAWKDMHPQMIKQNI